MKIDNIWLAEAWLKERKELVKVLDFEEANCDLRITVVSYGKDITFTARHDNHTMKAVRHDIFEALKRRKQEVDEEIEKL